MTESNIKLENSNQSNYFFYKVCLALVFLSMLSLTLVASADETYERDLDPADTWGTQAAPLTTSATNFIDMTSVPVSAITVGDSVELAVNLVTQTAAFTYNFFASEFPLGVNNRFITFRDVDANTDGTDEGDTANEFCYRLEFNATDIYGSPIPASNFVYTSTVNAQLVLLQPIAGSLAVRAI